MARKHRRLFASGLILLLFFLPAWMRPDPLECTTRWEAGDLATEVFIPTSLEGVPPSRMLVLLLGESAGEKKYTEIFRSLAEKEKAVLVSIRGPIENKKGGFAWFAEGRADAKDLDSLHPILVQVLRKLWKTIRVARQKTVLVGTGQGAVVAMDLGFQYPGLFPGGLLCISGKGYLASARLNGIKRSAMLGLKVFLIQDVREAPEESFRTASFLNDRGVHTALDEMDLGVTLPPHFDRVVSRALAWLGE